MAVTTKIMVIRHAEKPISSVDGVTIDGTADPESLIVRGWQRAGALATFFDPTNGTGLPQRIATPIALFASLDQKHGHTTGSLRPTETIQPLADKLTITPTTFEKTNIAGVCSVAQASGGVALICWQHEDIPTIAGQLPLVSGTTIPQPWPGHRFDLVWVFDLVSGGSPQYQFSQVPQLLLSSDSPSAIT
jgi:hypothetical protein